MGPINIFETNNYKELLHNLVDSSSDHRLGTRAALAEACGCQPAYISRVINKDAHLSLEQAYAASEFFLLDDLERKYFLLLVQRDRAGTKMLKTYFDSMIAELNLSKTKLKKRLKVADKLSNSDKQIYYSHWYHGAIHVSLSLRKSSKPSQLSKLLKLPISLVTHSLNFLVSCGLATEQDGFFSIGETKIHLGGDSNLVGRHHLNWRLQAIRSIESSTARSENDLHYSSVFTLSKDDARKVNEMCSHLIKNLHEFIEPSKEEEVFTICLDFFTLVEG